MSYNTPPLSHDKWDHWREDWVIAQRDFHDQMELPNGAPIGKRDLWEKVLDLQHEYDHVLRRIKFLVRKGMTSMMVLSDFLSQCITPIQQRANTAWLYIEENDITRLERGHGTELDQKVLEAMLMKLSSDLNSDDFVNPPPLCMSIFLDQAARSLLLKQMPTLDEIDIAVWHAGHISWTSDSQSGCFQWLEECGHHLDLWQREREGGVNRVCFQSGLPVTI
jgi:hypothetical protein